MLKIAHIISSLNAKHGGPPEGVRQLSNEMRRRGHEVVVFSLDGVEAPEEGLGDGVVCLGPVSSKYGFKLSLLKDMARVLPSFDVVIVNGIWQYHGLCAALVAGRLSIPYCVYPHGMLDPWSVRHHKFKFFKKWLYWQLFERHVAARAAALFFTCEEEARLAAVTFPASRFTRSTVGYGIRRPESHADEDCGASMAAFPQLRGREFLLFLGRIDPKKGVDLLIDSFIQVCTSVQNIDLVIVGPSSPDYRVALEERTARSKMSSRVHWLGMVRGTQKWGLLRSASAFVLPSHQENFGIAVVEALAVGTPVLISKKVNIWQTITASGAGFAQDDTLKGTSELLMRWIATPPPDQQIMRSSAETCFRAHFSIDATAGAFERAAYDASQFRKMQENYLTPQSGDPANYQSTS